MKKGDKITFNSGGGENVTGIVTKIHRSNKNLIGFTVEIGNTTHSYYGNDLTELIEIVQPS